MANGITQVYRVKETQFMKFGVLESNIFTKKLLKKGLF
jgi:hypothetical protein